MNKRFKKIKRWIQQGDYQQAVDKLETMTSSNPNDGEAWWMLANAYRYQQPFNPDAVRYALTEALRIHPFSTSAQQLLHWLNTHYPSQNIIQTSPSNRNAQPYIEPMMPEVVNTQPNADLPNVPILAEPIELSPKKTDSQQITEVQIPEVPNTQWEAERLEATVPAEPISFIPQTPLGTTTSVVLVEQVESSKSDFKDIVSINTNMLESSPSEEQLEDVFEMEGDDEGSDEGDGLTGIISGVLIGAYLTPTILVGEIILGAIWLLVFSVFNSPAEQIIIGLILSLLIFVPGVIIVGIIGAIGGAIWGAIVGFLVGVVNWITLLVLRKTPNKLTKYTAMLVSGVIATLLYHFFGYENLTYYTSAYADVTDLTWIAILNYGVVFLTGMAISAMSFVQPNDNDADDVSLGEVTHLLGTPWRFYGKVMGLGLKGSAATFGLASEELDKHHNQERKRRIYHKGRQELKHIYGEENIRRAEDQLRREGEDIPY